MSSKNHRTCPCFSPVSPLTRVPVLSRERVPEPERALISREFVPDDAHARQSRYLRRRRVNLDLAKVSAEVALLRGREILIAEEDDRTLCDQESELCIPKKGISRRLNCIHRVVPYLVFLLIAQLTELQPDDLGTDVGRQIDDLGRSREESLLLRVGALAWLVVLAAAVANRSGELDVGGLFCMTWFNASASRKSHESSGRRREAHLARSGRRRGQCQLSRGARECREAASWPG